MKKIFLYILTLVTLFYVSGCKKTLEENPIGLLAPQSFFKEKKDVEAAVFGAYGILASEPLYGRQFVNALMLRSDMCDIGNRGTVAARIQVNDFNMDANNAMVAAFWPAWYQVISAVNSAEAGAKSLGLAENDINPLIAEARFVRALSYYHLVRCFGDVPFIDFFVSDPELVKSIGKTKEADIYKSILKDLEFAKQWLPVTYVSDVRSRPTKATAAAYLASVYLTTADFPKAYTEAKWVIDNKATYNYELEANYQDLYRAELADNIRETIFTVDFKGLLFVGSQNDDLVAPMTGIRNVPQNGFGVVVPSLAVFTTWDARDYRRRVSFNDSTLNAAGVMINFTAFPNEKRPHIAKWRRFPGNANNDGRFTDHNYPDMRYAEILLIAAEALTETTGPTLEAIGYINLIRTRARNWPGNITGIPANSALGILTKQELIDLILEERRLELSFEWKRWYDIKRRQLGDIVFKGANSLEPRPNFTSSRDYLFPLPLTELQNNPNLNPQNTGY